MISPALCPRTLTLLLVIFSFSTIALSENLQLADGFTSFSVNLEFKMQPGETQMLEWGIINDDQNNQLHLEMFATGQGAELFVFEEDVVIEPGAVKQIEIFVIVPEDYATDLELRPQVFAKKIDPVKVESEGATINMIMQHVTNPRILIGDNPVYYAPEIIEEIIPDTTTNDDTPKTSTPKVESIPGETMQEKLDRIKAANEANQIMEELETEMEEIETDVEPGYIAEPEADPEPVDFEEELQACGFWEWFLGLFGIKSDCI